MKIAGQMVAFTAVSLLSFGLDWSLFSALWMVLPPETPARLFASVSVARCASLIFNYFCNRQFVFCSRKSVGQEERGASQCRRSKRLRSFPRYVALAIALLAGSWAILKIIHGAFPRIPLAAAKPVVDAGLFVVSFLVQRKFVFAAKNAVVSEGTDHV